VADITDPDALARVRMFKQALKASNKAKEPADKTAGAKGPGATGPGAKTTKRTRSPDPAGKH
jgi:hypothetical protein